MMNLSTGQLIDSLMHCSSSKCDHNCPKWPGGIERAGACSCMLMRESAERLEQLKAQCDRQEIEQHMLHTEPDAVNDDLLAIVNHVTEICDDLVRRKRILPVTLLRLIEDVIHDRSRRNYEVDE